MAKETLTKEEVQSETRRQFVKAVYTAPAIVLLGSLSELAVGQTAQSCDPLTDPLGCPPDPP